ncbi:hypothetical protein VUR80DRAFT_6649 [Thermomyces stellatus]
MVGGGEVLRDEQIFLAHKCANPTKYAPAADSLTEDARLQLGRFPPTPVQLQVWDDLCHVAPTLSFTRPAKYMYRSVAQFSAWALARAQDTSIAIPINEASATSVSHSDSTDSSQDTARNGPGTAVGKAGDPLPPFKNHMIRQRVTRHGTIFPLEPESELPACILKPQDVGVIQAGPVRSWLETRARWDARYAKEKRKVHKRMAREMAEGYLVFGDGETPPPSALAGRRRRHAAKASWRERKKKGVGLAIWSLWGSAHDKAREMASAPAGKEGSVGKGDQAPRSRSGRTGAMSHQGVTDENQASEATSPSGTTDALQKETPALSGTTELDNETSVVSERRGTVVEDLLKERKEKEEENRRLLGPGHAVTGVAGRRPTVDGVSMPFSLGGGTAGSSIVTLNSEDVASPRASRAGDSLTGASVSREGFRGGESSLKGVGIEDDGKRPSSGVLRATETPA